MVYQHFDKWIINACIIGSLYDSKSYSYRKDRKSPKIALILGIVFMTLTFIGGGYVLINHGQVNAGYAAVPGIWTIICFGFYRRKRGD